MTAAPGTQALSPEQLANQLFDAVLMQSPGAKPQEAARQVITFLTQSLFFAITSSKNDPIVYLTETIIYAVASSTSGDEAARLELLKHVSDTIAKAPPIPKAAPAATPGK